MKNINIKNKRLIIQSIVLFTVIISAINHYLQSVDKSIPWISETLFHYICPTCGVTSIYQFFTSPTIWADKVKSILGIAIGMVVIATIIFGPVICGYICPFGTIQDLVSNIGKRMFRGKYNRFIPKKLDKNLKYIRYITLILTIVLTAKGGVILIESLNPYHAFLGVFNAKAISILGFFILCIVVMASLFIQRPWCRYLCPYGAFLGIFNKFKVFRIVREKNTCVGCKKCDRVCPMGIEIHSEEAVRNLSCISCLDCVSEKVCPKQDTIFYTSKDTEELENETIEIDEAK